MDEQLKMSHPLIRLSNLMNWEQIERSLGGNFASKLGRPALRPRLVAGLLYLQHANDASDEAVGFEPTVTWGIPVIRVGHHGGIGRAQQQRDRYRFANFPNA
jgi:hypothetical protein